MAFAAALPAIISAVGAGLGALGKSNKSQTSQVQRFSPQQTGVMNQALSGFGQQLPGAFSYLQGILGNEPGAFQNFEAPFKRQFNEQIIPSIAERFSGLGSGAQRSSAFQQALGQAGASLTENLASLRSGLQSNALSQLLGIGQLGLTPQFESIYQPGSMGGLQRFGASLGGGIGTGLEGLNNYSQMQELKKLLEGLKGSSKGAIE